MNESQADLIRRKSSERLSRWLWTNDILSAKRRGDMMKITSKQEEKIEQARESGESNDYIVGMEDAFLGRDLQFAAAGIDTTNPDDYDRGQDYEDGYRDAKDAMPLRRIQR